MIATTGGEPSLNASSLDVLDGISPLSALILKVSSREQCGLWKRSNGRPIRRRQPNRKTIRSVRLT